MLWSRVFVNTYITINSLFQETNKKVSAALNKHAWKYKHAQWKQKKEKEKKEVKKYGYIKSKKITKLTFSISTTFL